ncbi:MAG TPA: acyl-CoA dehydrogenase [Caldimonas sp.]|jgi:alkylation response protein AidB-like acyl-CoA dehydrogenase|nr:acyl-CoA dehydrogenase [Caldimonas sp.]HEX2539683.1 acyl-CoA dehydrogenase [Caldimonas sp.]
MIDPSRVDAGALPGAEEHGMLRDSMRGFLETHWPGADAIARGRDPVALAAIWSLLVEQGVAALGSEPSEGRLREAAIVMEALGRAACPAPFLGALLANLAFAAGRDAPGSAAALVDRLHSGAARVCWSFAAHDSGAHAAAIAWHGERVSGTVRFVDAAVAATHLVVATTRDRSGLAIVELAGEAARVTPTRALGAEGLAEVTLTEAPAAFVPIGDEAIADLLRVARVAVLARGHGAARRAFEMAVDYAKERRQFGQPIGRFQAIQHKLANSLIALEGVRVTLEHAAESFDLGAPSWRYFAAAAVAFAAPALRQVSLETQHAFGAIGYAEEHEAPRHFRRAHLDAIAFGGAAAARRELAAQLLDDPEATLPEYDLGPDGNAFRSEVRAWLAEHWAGERKAAFDAREFHHREFDASFARDLGATGWLGLGWPREFGGQARTPLEQLAFMEVMERAEAPRIGAAVQANALMMFGTPAQQARWLPEILRGEAMHGMGYSEPDAGSDLASLRTSAVRVRDDAGDHWVINGQKIWTTTYWGKYMFLAARTDRDARPAHAGISMFIVPMDTPGISVTPATTMYDGSFANIFYDDVRVPADALVGPLNGGWKVLTDALANERGLVGGGIVLKVAHAFDLLCRDVRESSSPSGALRDDAVVRDRIATLAAEIEVGRRLMIHCAELATGGTTPPELGAISKVFSGELMERFGEAALDLLGPRAALSQGAPGALRNGRYEQGLRHSLMWVISIGTNEIQRSLIAQRGLGLPRSG